MFLCGIGGPGGLCMVIAVGVLLCNCGVRQLVDRAEIGVGLPVR